MNKGWGFPMNSRKAHYFAEGELISICSKMMYAGPLEDDNHHSSSNCADCKRRRDKLDAKIAGKGVEE
jgi:hypothetical protein